MGNNVKRSGIDERIISVNALYEKRNVDHC